MGQTSSGLRYPDGSAAVMVHVDIKALADDVQAKVIDADVNRGVKFQAGRAITNASGYVTIALDESKFSTMPRVVASAVQATAFRGQYVVTRDETTFPYVTLWAYFGGSPKSDVTIEWIAMGS